MNSEIITRSQNNQKRHSVKIVSYLPQSSYFPFFFADNKNINFYQTSRYTNIIQNKHNLTKIMNEEQHCIKSEIEEITQLYQKFDLEIPSVIQKQLSDATNLFDNKQTSRSARSMKFTPFFAQPPQNRTDEATKSIISKRFDVEAANKLNNTKLEMVSEDNSVFNLSTNMLAKEGVYIPPSIKFNLGNLILQSFINVHEPILVRENNINSINKSTNNKNITKKNTKNKKKKKSSNKKNKGNNKNDNDKENENNNEIKKEETDNFGDLNNQDNKEDLNNIIDDSEFKIDDESREDDLFNLEIPLINETLPDESYMKKSFEEKLAYELESLGFAAPINKNLLMANSFMTSNGIDSNIIDQKIDKANKAKEFLRDFTIDHQLDIEKHNQKVAMIEYFNQSIKPQ